MRRSFVEGIPSICLVLPHESATDPVLPHVVPPPRRGARTSRGRRAPAGRSTDGPSWCRLHGGKGAGALRKPSACRTAPVVHAAAGGHRTRQARGCHVLRRRVRPIPSGSAALLLGSLVVGTASSRGPEGDTGGAGCGPGPGPGPGPGSQSSRRGWSCLSYGVELPRHRSTRLMARWSGLASRRVPCDHSSRWSGRASRSCARALGQGGRMDHRIRPFALAVLLAATGCVSVPAAPQPTTPSRVPAGSLLPAPTGSGEQSRPPAQGELAPGGMAAPSEPEGTPAEREEQGALRRERPHAEHAEPSRVPGARSRAVRADAAPGEGVRPRRRAPRPVVRPARPRAQYDMADVCEAAYGVADPSLVALCRAHYGR